MNTQENQDKMLDDFLMMFIITKDIVQHMIVFCSRAHTS